MHSPDEQVSGSGHRLLFETEDGAVRHCPCHDVLILQYRDRWMAMTRAQYREFHARIIRTVHCPMPVAGGEASGGVRYVFRGADGEPVMTLEREQVAALERLLDSARYMLEAHDAAEAGYRAAG